MTALLRIAGLGLGLALSSASAAAQFRTVGDEPAILYDAPSAKSKRVFVLSAGYPVEVLVTLEGWIKIRDSGGSIGWLEAKSLTAKRGVIVRANVVDVRAAADPGAKVAFKAARGVVLEWLEAMPGGWVRVRHAEAGQGFVQASELWGT